MDMTNDTCQICMRPGAVCGKESGCGCCDNADCFEAGMNYWKSLAARQVTEIRELTEALQTVCGEHDGKCKCYPCKLAFKE